MQGILLQCKKQKLSLDLLLSDGPSQNTHVEEGSLPAHWPTETDVFPFPQSPAGALMLKEL